MVLPISLLNFLLALIIIQQSKFFFLDLSFIFFLSSQSFLFEVEALFPLQQASGKLPFKCSHRPLQTVPTKFQGGFPFLALPRKKSDFLCLSCSSLKSSPMFSKFHRFLNGLSPLKSFSSPLFPNAKQSSFIWRNHSYLKVFGSYSS